MLRIDQYGDECTLEATAVYLVAAIAQTIEGNLRIPTALFDDDQLTLELARDVRSVIGDTDYDSAFIKTRRDPWMWEAISHMLVHLSRHANGFHPSGRVLAKTNVKHDVNDHGLDLIAIYEAPTKPNLGISAGECKAYLDDPSRAITDASTKLREVDANKRDIDIRATVNQLRGFLDTNAQSQLAGSFWRDERTYLPFVCCDQSSAAQWSRARNSLRRLAVPVSRKLLYPLPLAAAREKFERIGHFMRRYVSTKDTGLHV